MLNVFQFIPKFLYVSSAIRNKQVEWTTVPPHTVDLLSQMCRAKQVSHRNCKLGSSKHFCKFFNEINVDNYQCCELFIRWLNIIVWILQEIKKSLQCILSIHFEWIYCAKCYFWYFDFWYSLNFITYNF